MSGAENNKPNRLASIDAFRGLAVLLMAAANYLGGIAWVPAFLKHTPDAGYTIPDVVAPMFLVAVGFTMGLSARKRRQRSSTAAAMGSIAARNLALIGIGAVISAGQALLQPGGERSQTWGVLQAIGGAGLLVLPMIYLKPWVRALIGFGLLAAFQILLFCPAFTSAVFDTVQGGLPGVISWGGLLMLATAAADWFFAAGTNGARRAVLSAGGVGALALGLIVSLWFPISKNRVSPAYMLVNLGICLLLFLLLHLAADRPCAPLPLLRAAGANPLAMYVAHLLVLGLITLPGAAWWYEKASPALAAAQGIVLLAALLMFGWWMRKRGLIVKL